ncbi:MAG TPA: polyprenol phosphomannose-dependent alpha 1,6 mannosyltransferase MptB [Brumimicrobium sp.]|nr:polyprenol phosphomannose-dependent alpha 1,6 mannosyltransferase MptB [Brumimicrobium sp.]
MQTSLKYLAFALILYFSALVYLNYGIEQTDFLQMFAVYIVAFTIYLYCIRMRQSITLKKWLWIALVLFLIPLIATPPLSPDIYRFLWDGELVTLGIHPYSFTPNELMKSEALVNSSEYMKFLYENTTDLSKDNYTIYPTVHQLYFLIPTVLTDHFMTSLIILRILMLGTLVFGLKYLIKILELFKIPEQHIVLLILNPILIIEVMGNLHFEGIMLAWLFPGIYFLMNKQWVKSSLFWAIAINIKLTPLILFPFVLRYLGFKESLKFYFLTTLFSVGLLSVYMWSTVFWNFMQSIELYFNNFEFNAGVFYLFKWLSSFIVKGNPTLIIGPALSIIALLMILFIALYRPIKNDKTLLNRMMWGYVIYLLMATTVHPWYIVLPLGLAVFSVNLGVIFWTLLIMLSYGFYTFDNKVWSYLLIAVEYILLFVLLVNPRSKLQNSMRNILRL